MMQMAVIALMAASTGGLWVSAGRSPHFKEMVEHMFKGQPLPSMTYFFLDHGLALTWAFTAACVVITAVIVILHRKVWPPAVGLLMAGLGIALAQLAREALLAPMLFIIQNLT